MRTMRYDSLRAIAIDRASELGLRIVHVIWDAITPTKIFADELIQLNLLVFKAKLVDIAKDVDEVDQKAYVHHKAADYANQIAQVKLLHHGIESICGDVLAIVKFSCF